MTGDRGKVADLRLLMVSTSYPLDSQDWRGRFIADMAASVAKRKGVELSLWAPPGDLPPGVTSGLLADDADWLRELSRRGGIASLLRRRSFAGAAAAFGLLRRLGRAYRHQRPEVAHVNWLQNALPLWGTGIPTLVTVLGSDFGLLKLPGMVPALRRVFVQRRTILAPNAGWMAPRLEQLFGDVAEVRSIPFGVEAHWFGVERTPVSPSRWLAVTRLTRAKIGPLFEWGEGLFGPGRELHLFGPMQEETAIPPWVHYHGPTHPAELRDNWFPRAAGLLTLSRHDEGRPQVILEAMAAGLPVIASDLPAHRDVIRDGETGCLASTPEAFRAALERLDLPASNRTTGETARTWVRTAIGTWDDCAARYQAAYGDLLERRV